MKNPALGVLLAAASLLCAGPVRAAAEEEALVPLPSILDFTGGEGFGVALGVGVEYEGAYDGSDETELAVEPAGAVQYRSGNNLFFWEGFELGWRGLIADRWLVQAGARYEEGLEPDDSEDGRLNGVLPRDSHVVGFLEVRRGLGEDWRNWVAGRVMGGAGGFGWLGVVAAGHRFGQRLDGLGTEVYGFLTFGTDDFINKDFGVTARDAASSGLRQTTLGGGYRSAGVQVVHRRNLAPKLQAIAQAGLERYSGAISDSPIAREDFEYELSLALVWRF